MKSGQSKYGYGKSKELVMQCHAKGMSMSEIAKVNKCHTLPSTTLSDETGFTFQHLTGKSMALLKIL